MLHYFWLQFTHKPDTLNHSSKSERIHALDSLRAIMMMLGLVIHTAITYGVVNYGGSWPLKDNGATSPFMDWLVSLIHAFRMPVFFIVAGFFGALLFYKRGPRKMALNRLDRILYPFIVFLIILWPMVQVGFEFSRQVIAGNESALANSIAPFQNLGAFIPERTMHLWFLYYLFLGLGTKMTRFLPEHGSEFLVAKAGRQVCFHTCSHSSQQLCFCSNCLFHGSLQ